MKRLIASFALTLVLTAGIASPISAKTKPSPITPVAKDGAGPCPMPLCDGN
jgi:hypothetical protein